LNKNTSGNSNTIHNLYLALLCLSLILAYSNSLLAQSPDEEVIFFDSDTNSISSESKEILNSTIDLLNDMDDYVITLEGYSDITGKADYNIELSRKRAQLVKDYLVNRGLSSSKITVVGKGGTEKYGVGETNEALQANRRVNLIVDIPFVPAIEIEPEEAVEEQIAEEVPDQPEPTAEPETEPPAEQPPITPAPVIATPAPAKPVLKIPSNKLEKLIRENASDGINFITPREMQIGQTYIVEAEVSNTFVDAVVKKLPDFPIENKVGLNLIGKTFDIEAQSTISSNVKTVEKDAPAIWQWNVTPQSDGFNSLILSIQIVPEGFREGAEHPEFATFHRIIDVKPSLVHSITSSYWIMGILILLIITGVAWILHRRVRIN